MSKKAVSGWKNQPGTFKSHLMRLTAPILAVVGCVGISVPSMAADGSYDNNYRACAGRLLGVGISEQAAARACARALRPTELASCVVFIDNRTEISATDALSVCEQARRPKELATCVVSISRNTQEAVNPAVLNYCSRSLLPERFAYCVVDLRSQINIAPIQALDICIDGSDRIGGVPALTSPSQPPAGFSPTFETQPIPASPGNR
ncbi:hypothetical protein Nos7524_4396 [Nostoc sp. PCC 7524]|uniref:hypothetical protein n=1 Tax=Nostoc sp. (strain ATCC 29411 / PCC 7524) TaxID=28072 RepID=UPI00029F3508|nr:hypothetical protein [Nostoc sp. PCC 7524]AFY50155.1 hypothetical protein Nos7524_4396 [Nostoc sp. PCC 7524]